MQDETPHHVQVDTTNAAGEFESQLEADIHTAQQDITAVPLRWRRYSRNLASLSAEYTSFWQDPSFIEMAERIQADGSRQFFTFEDQAESWNRSSFADHTQKALELIGISLHKYPKEGEPVVYIRASGDSVEYHSTP